MLLSVAALAWGMVKTRQQRDRAVEAETVDGDPSPGQDVRAMVDFVVETFGRLDVALNNAGSGGPAGPLAEIDEAEALAASGRSREAIELLEHAWQAIPESVELLQALARVLASADDPEVRDGKRALDLAQRSLRAGATPSRLETLAMASAEAGDFDEAVRVQRRVIQMVTWQGPEDLLPRLEANLARYLAGETCCAEGPDPPR